MDFELTEFQTDLAQGVRRLCEGRFPLETLIGLPQTLAQFVRGERG